MRLLIRDEFNNLEVHEICSFGYDSELECKETGHIFSGFYFITLDDRIYGLEIESISSCNLICWELLEIGYLICWELLEKGYADITGYGLCYFLDFNA